MADIITMIYGKIRAIVGDFAKSDFETFTYSTTSIFTLTTSNITSIDKVLKNNVELGSGEYSFDSTTNKIEISASLASGDVIEVDFSYNKYSDTELKEYVRGALVYISVAGVCDDDYEIETNSIYPTPDNRECDMIALVTGILIKPDYTQYNLPNGARVIYANRKLEKDEKINQFLNRFKHGLGVNDVIEIEYEDEI